MTTFDSHANLVYGTVSVVPSPALTGTQLTLNASPAVTLPTPPFNMLVWPPNVVPLQGNTEVVRVTAVGGAGNLTLSITRAQEGSTAIAISSGYLVAVGATAKTFTDIESAITAETARAGAAEALAAQKANNLSDVADAGSSRLNLHVAELAVCQVAATSNVTLSGLQTIDGYTTLAGDLVLCTGQSTASQNGPWLAASGSWTRPHEYASGSSIVAGRTVSVVNGTVNAKSHWLLTTAGTVTVDTTATSWATNLPSSVVNGIAIQMPSPTGVTATDTAAYNAAFASASAIAAAGGKATIYFQDGTYSLPGGITPAQGVSHVGVLPGISQINQGAGYLPDGEWNYISGTILKGNVDGSPTGDAIWANTTSPGSFNPNTLGGSQISGCRIIGFGIDGYVNGLHIGALNIMGVVWSEIDEIYAKNCSGWGVYMVNYQHVSFGKISTCLCTNGQYYGSGGAATYFNPGNSTYRDLFHKAINTSGQARNVVFEANSWNVSSPGSITIGTVKSLQVNAYNQHPAAQTVTLTASSSTLAATSGAGLAVGMPCTFATSVGGLIAGIVYIIQSVSGNNFTIGTSNQSAAVVPNASTTVSMTSGVYAGVEIQAVQSGGLINGRLDYVDVEGSPAVGIYTENAAGLEINVHAAPGVGIVGRGSPNSRFQSEQFGLVTDFDSGCGGSAFNGLSATPLQYPLAGLVYNTARGPASALSIGKGNSGSGGGDIESRASGLLYPVQAGVAQHITVQGSSKTLTPFQCGTIVAPVGAGSGITYTLATIVTQTTAGSQASANVGLWHEVINLSSNALTVSTNGTQLFNRVSGLTSLTVQPGQAQKFIAMEDNSSTQYWLALPPVPVSGGTATYSAPGYTAAGLTGATAASRYVGATVSGAPATGTWAVGDYIIDQSGSLWICTTAGTPGTWTVISGVTPPPSANFRFMPSAISQWYCNPLVEGQRTIVPTQGNLALHVFQAPPEGLTIDKLDVNVQTVGSAGAVTRMGIYAVTNQTNPFKWASTVAWATLLVDAGTVATDGSTGQKVITLGTPQAIAGYQWFAVGGVDQTATAATRYVGGTAGALFASPFGNQTALGYNAGAGMALEVGSITGSLPSTFSPASLQATDSGVGIHRSA